jgi:predicted dehydrogenase
VTVYALQLATSVLGPVRRVAGLGNQLMPERSWHGRTIGIEVEDNNALLLEFHNGTLGVAIGADRAGGSMNPWGGMSLYGTHGSLEITRGRRRQRLPAALPYPPQRLVGTQHPARRSHPTHRLPLT